jgi:acetyl-CoA carboxylase biotin carboxyl carrier protein
MDLRKIKTLIELLEASDLSEIEINEGDDSIRLSRASSVAAPAPQLPLQYAASAPAAVAPVSAPASDAPAPAIAGHAVESPTVGTFYARSSPDADAFVKVGDSVSKGTTLCVVEAMKTFNEIQADRAGTIVEVLKSDGDPVEFGEALFIIN